MASSRSPTPSGSWDGPGLSAWLPGELLIVADKELLRSLDESSEERCEVRRSMLDDHVRSMGSEAVDFVDQFEQTTCIEFLGLADDPAGTAALLGTFRLIERGEITADDGVEMLRESLGNLSEEWLDEVNRIVTEQPDWFQSSAPSSSALDLVTAWASGSLSEIGGAFRSVSRRIPVMGREFLSMRSQRDWALVPAGLGWILLL